MTCSPHGGRIDRLLRGERFCIVRKKRNKKETNSSRVSNLFLYFTLNQ